MSVPEQNIPVMRFPASESWYEGAPLGNGDLGAIVYASKDTLFFAVGKNDVWDRRLASDIRPQPKPVCTIRVWQCSGDGRKLKLGAVAHSLQLGEGELVSSAPHLEIAARVQKAGNLILLRLKGKGRKTVVCLARHTDMTHSGIAPPQMCISGKVGIVCQDLPKEATYPGGFRCVAAGSCLGTAQPAQTEEGIAWESEGECILTLAVATTRDCDDPESQARQLLASAADEGDEGLRARHIREWTEYWDRSSIWIDDDETHALWYRWMYMLACATRPGAVAPGLFSPWIVQDQSAWNGGYTIDYNFEQTYASVLSSNHPELMEPYFTAVEAMLPAARGIARKRYGLEGLVFPHEMFPVAITDWPTNDGNIVETLWLVQHFWEYFLYTQDVSFLAERCFPIISRCADFMASLVTEGPDGTLAIPDYDSLEHPMLPGARNGTPVLAFARYLLKAAISGAGILGKTQSIPRWEEVLERMPPYPRSTNQAGEIYVDCESDDGLYNVSPPVQLLRDGWRPSKLPGNHGAWMYYNLANSLIQVWPAAEIDADSPPDDLLTAIRTWMTIKLEGFNNLVSHHVIAARLGIVSYRDLKSDIKYRRLPNGFETTKANQLTPDFEYDRGYFAYWTYGLYSENCGIPLAINEMMLQSHGGVIKVFPAFDPYRKARFRRLRARGGFLVSAEVDRGFVRWIEVEASVEGICRLRLPWPRAALGTFETLGGRKVSFSEEGNDILFRAEAGKVYRIVPITKVHPKGK